MGHDARMPLSDTTDECLELIEEMLVQGLLPEREEIALRQLAATHLMCGAATAPALTHEDRQIFALALARWQYAFSNDGGNMMSVVGPFAFPVSTAVFVTGLSIEAVGTALAHLGDAGLVGVENDDDGCLRVNLDGAIRSVADDLAALLYRDFVDRHGEHLRQAAEYFLETIGEELEELAEVRGADPRRRVLQTEYDAFVARMRVDELMQNWPEAPKAVYAWLEDLGRIQERMAILNSFPRTGLADDLRRIASERILILSERFRPPSRPVPNRVLAR